ncbi:hypothetical protein D3C76_1662130 [compost metagenome]
MHEFHLLSPLVSRKACSMRGEAIPRPRLSIIEPGGTVKGGGKGAVTGWTRWCCGWVCAGGRAPTGGFGRNLGELLTTHYGLAY